MADDTPNDRDRHEVAINPNEWPGPWCDNEDCSCNTPGFVCREFQGFRADGRCPQCGWLGEHHNGSTGNRV